MTADLLAALAARDIRLLVEDGRLVLDAPAGAVTAADRAAVRARKAELLAALRPALPVAPGCPRCVRPSPVPGAWCDGCLETPPAPPVLRYPVAVRWASERGWLRVRDPFSGEWHEIRAADAPACWRDALRRRRN